jgi:hypothetical protein
MDRMTTMTDNVPLVYDHFSMSHCSEVRNIWTAEELQKRGNWRSVGFAAGGTGRGMFGIIYWLFTSKRTSGTTPWKSTPDCCQWQSHFNISSLRACCTSGTQSGEVISYVLGWEVFCLGTLMIPIIQVGAIETNYRCQTLNREPSQLFSTLRVPDWLTSTCVWSIRMSMNKNVSRVYTFVCSAYEGENTTAAE